MDLVSKLFNRLDPSFVFKDGLLLNLDPPTTLYTTCRSLLTATNHAHFASQVRILSGHPTWCQTNDLLTRLMSSCCSMVQLPKTVTPVGHFPNLLAYTGNSHHTSISPTCLYTLVTYATQATPRAQALVGIATFLINSLAWYSPLPKKKLIILNNHTNVPQGV